jgi:hypothetical protein
MLFRKVCRNARCTFFYLFNTSVNFTERLIIYCTVNNKATSRLYKIIFMEIKLRLEEEKSIVLTLAADDDIYTIGKLFEHTNVNSTQVYPDAVMEIKVKNS